MSLKKIVYSLFIIFFFVFSAESQEVLSSYNTSWSNVLPGTVICEPVLTSYGFCLVTDARTICSFTDSGIQLWEKTVSRSRKVKLSALPGDFILFQDLTSNTITLLNPSGCEIWNLKLDYCPKNKAFSGRDGRFFLAGERTVECYGINGIRKWSLETELQKEGLMQELPDGSLVVFLAEEKGKTKGLRISPFGKILEEIIFSGEVVKAYTCKAGILLIFTDGTAGLFSLDENESKNRWVLSKKNTASSFAVNHKGDAVYLDYDGKNVTVHEINLVKGSVEHSFKITGIDSSKITVENYSDKGIFISDTKKAVLYSLDGIEIWNAEFPQTSARNIWNYEIFSNDGYLVFCQKDWSLNAYRVIQTKLSEKNGSDVFYKDYGQLYKKASENFDINYARSFSRESVSDDRIYGLKNGDYGESELVWSSEISGICNSYSNHLSTNDFGTRKEKSVFDLDTPGFEKILTQLTLFCNEDTQNCCARILGKTENKSFLKVLLNGIKQNGYDPDGNLLKAIEKQAAAVDYKDTVLTALICDSVYSICVFMGRPAYNKRGKELLKNFLYPNFDAKTRNYARDTLKKIIALDL